MSNIDKMEILNSQEFKHLTDKINSNVISVDYFRKNMFNTTCRSSQYFKNKRIIYEDEAITIKCNRSLHQRHRDLLSILNYEDKSQINNDGSYYIGSRRTNVILSHAP